MTGDARDPGYFDALYAANADPWRFETSSYEAQKYAETIAALSRSRYADAVEVGCSIGVLTEQLASRADRLLGVDVAQAALDKAAARCAALPHVHFAKLRVPDDALPGRYDLIVLSEVLYYFDQPTLLRVSERLRATAMPGADLVLVHWLGETPDYPQTGDEAVEAFITAIGDWAVVTRQERRQDYRLDVLRAAPAD
ncbi:SAM-dependent methyltransferase [Glacieibacterium frigidum]|uniref:Methyltransferase domain-containing protein n=1 Tax=Glacieibacterium frigidum TaxID=2593303 RepID=A0A552U9U3_9SPHN|nr:SAM-dependent methyltransferase [Glacieibacterium frigidum]TRW14959.1 methyltransferase domain-containing protein [Glacieibacterium frigidum]